jgi:hypothetical protein
MPRTLRLFALCIRGMLKNATTVTEYLELDGKMINESLIRKCVDNVDEL